MKTAISVLSGIGNPDAPRGSKDWAIYFAFLAKQETHDVRREIRGLQEILKKLKDHEAHKALGLSSWDDLCRREIGITEEQAEKVLAAAPDVTVALVLGTHGGDRRSPTVKAEAEGKADQGDIVTLKERGNSATYLTARLDRDRPDIAARVHAGEISARKGAIEAGIIRVPTKLEIARRAIEALAPDDRAALQDWLNTAFL